MMPPAYQPKPEDVLRPEELGVPDQVDRPRAVMNAPERPSASRSTVPVGHRKPAMRAAQRPDMPTTVPPKAERQEVREIGWAAAEVFLRLDSVFPHPQSGELIPRTSSDPENARALRALIAAAVEECIERNPELASGEGTDRIVTRLMATGLGGEILSRKSRESVNSRLTASSIRSFYQGVLTSVAHRLHED